MPPRNLYELLGQPKDLLAHEKSPPVMKDITNLDNTQVEIERLKQREIYLTSQLDLKEAELALYYKHMASLQQRLDSSNDQLSHAQVQLNHASSMSLENIRMVEHYKVQSNGLRKALLAAEEKNVRQFREFVQLQGIVEGMQAGGPSTARLATSSTTQHHIAPQVHPILPVTSQQPVTPLAKLVRPSLPTPMKSAPALSTQEWPPLPSPKSQNQITGPTPYVSPYKPTISTENLAGKRLNPHSADFVPTDGRVELPEKKELLEPPLFRKPEKKEVSISPPRPFLSPPRKKTNGISVEKPAPSIKREISEDTETLSTNLRTTAQRIEEKTAELRNSQDFPLITATEGPSIPPSTAIKLDSNSVDPVKQAFEESPGAATRRWLDQQLQTPSQPVVTSTLPTMAVDAPSRLIDFSNEGSPVDRSEGLYKEDTLPVTPTKPASGETTPTQQISTPLQNAGKENTRPRTLPASANAMQEQATQQPSPPLSPSVVPALPIENKRHREGSAAPTSVNLMSSAPLKALTSKTSIKQSSDLSSDTSAILARLKDVARRGKWGGSSKSGSRIVSQATTSDTPSQSISTTGENARTGDGWGDDDATEASKSANAGWATNDNAAASAQSPTESFVHAPEPELNCDANAETKPFKEDNAGWGPTKSNHDTADTAWGKEERNENDLTGREHGNIGPSEHDLSSLDNGHVSKGATNTWEAEGRKSKKTPNVFAYNPPHLSKGSRNTTQNDTADESKPPHLGWAPDRPSLIDEDEKDVQDLEEGEVQEGTPPSRRSSTISKEPSQQDTTPSPTKLNTFLRKRGISSEDNGVLTRQIDDLVRKSRELANKVYGRGTKVEPSEEEYRRRYYEAEQRHFPLNGSHSLDDIVDEEVTGRVIKLNAWRMNSLPTHDIEKQVFRSVMPGLRGLGSYNGLHSWTMHPENSEKWVLEAVPCVDARWTLKTYVKEFSKNSGPFGKKQL